MSVDGGSKSIPKTRHDYTISGSNGASAVLRLLHQDGAASILTDEDMHSVITISAAIFNRHRGRFYLGKNALVLRAMESPEHDAIAKLDPLTLHAFIAASHPHAQTIAEADNNDDNGVTLATLCHPISSPVTLRLVLAFIGGADYVYKTYKNSKKGIRGPPDPRLGQVVRRPELSACFADVNANSDTYGMWTTLWTDEHIKSLTNYTVDDCTKADIEGDEGAQGMDLLRAAVGTTVIVTFTTVLDSLRSAAAAAAPTYKLVVEEIAAEQQSSKE